MKPVITIITPVLNMVEHIAGCIKSAADQKVGVQHIIVDGGSTDGTLEVIKRLMNPNITLISEKDHGQSDAINKGLKLAKGEFFNWLNADDILTENALKEVLNMASVNINVVVGKCEHVELKTEKAVATGRTFVDSNSEKTLALYSMAQPSQFYRTETVRSLGGLNANLHLAMDMDLWFRYVLKYGTSKIAITDKVLSHFHLHESSKTTQQTEAMSAEKYAVFLGLLQSMNSPSWLMAHVSGMASTLRLKYDTEGFDPMAFLSEFTFHLMRMSYAKGDLQLSQKLFSLVSRGSLLSHTELMEWRLRVHGTSSKLIKTLRGK